MKKGFLIVDAGAMANKISQLRAGLPKAVVQAKAILENADKITEEARAEADKIADAADQIYTDTVNKAKEFERKVKEEADAYDQNLRQQTQENVNAIMAEANARAEQMLFSAQQQAQKLVEENEITRRAQAYALETRERAQKDADSIYNQACVHTDKMLSGAAAALSRSAGELATLRDNLLGQTSNVPGPENTEANDPLR